MDTRFPQTCEHCDEEGGVCITCHREPLSHYQPPPDPEQQLDGLNIQLKNNREKAAGAQRRSSERKAALRSELTASRGEHDRVTQKKEALDPANEVLKKNEARYEKRIEKLY